MSLLIVEKTLDERLLLEHLVSEDEFCIQQIGLESYFVYIFVKSAKQCTKGEQYLMFEAAKW